MLDNLPYQSTVFFCIVVVVVYSSLAQMSRSVNLC